ncbi:MAG: hypothetical protein J2P37_35965, partial [Ktedonobacteraceae bacterium]|nr:hypothetical protein [Ktedonobacteraceae bacterium]
PPATGQPYAAQPQPSFTPPASTPPAPVLQPPANPNPIQRLLIHLFQLNLASNPWLGVGLGGLIPALLGAIVFVILFSIVYAFNPANADAFFGTLSVGSPVRDALQALLLAHGIGRLLSGSASANGASITFTADIATPLQLTLIVPALLLILGGYIAASTDMQSRARSSLWRGAGIAVAYTLLLLLFSTQAGGDLTSFLGSALSLGTQGSFTLNMDSGALLLLGLLWGVLFGLLGASLKLANGQWRHWLHTFLRTNPRPQLTGLATGGLFAAGLGLLLMLLVTWSTLAGSNLNQFIQGNDACFSGISGNVSAASFVQTPFLAFQLLAFASGAPIAATVHSSGMKELTDSIVGSSCSSNGANSLSLLNGHVPPVMFLLVLVPLISLFLGGRISAAYTRTRQPGPAALQGALIAIPFTVVMMILAACFTLRFSMAFSGTVPLLGSIPDTRVEVALGAGIIEVMLWSLLIGAIGGALGGLYQVSTFGHAVDVFLGILGNLLKAPFQPFMPLLDKLTGRANTAKRGRTLTIVYSAALAALVLTLVAIVVGML